MSGSLTPRDQIEKILDVVRRAARYTWLVAIVAGVGGVLSVLLALTRSHQYESETVLFYREMISQSVLQGREVVQSSSTLSARYKEMLLARSNLIEVVRKFKLFPDTVEDEGEVAAADLVRARISFRDKGAGTFRIAYKGDSPKEAQAVTLFLTEQLKDADNELRREQAQVTVDFLGKEKQEADTELKGRERTLAQFLAQHPEFAAEPGMANNGPGAGIRAAQQKKAAPTPLSAEDSQLSALERQRRRIEARLANPNKPVSVPTSVKTPEIRQAEREVAEAARHLQETQAQFTDKHPDVLSARARLSEAQKRLQVAALGAGASSATTEALLGPVDPEVLKRELRKVEAEIAQVRSRRSSGAPAAPSASQVANDVVELETEWARLSRAVDEALERVSSLESRVFTAEITASSEFADAAQLSVIDEAYLPAKPSGKSRKTMAMAGGLVFGALGIALAFGLALIDDRIYRRADLDRLGIAPVLVEIPDAKRKHRRYRG